MGHPDLVQPALLLSLALFGIGTLGVFLRRNVITLLMCIELMLNGVNLAFVAFSRASGRSGVLDAQVLVFFVMVVAAAEAQAPHQAHQRLLRHQRPLQHPLQHRRLRRQEPSLILIPLQAGISPPK